MTSNTQKKVYPSEKIKEDLKKLLLVLIGAIIFSFLMGILANIIVNYFISQLFILMIIILIVTTITGYALYYYYVFAPHCQINEDIMVSIIYNPEGGEVIDDPFDGYYPQKMAWQTFKRFKEKFPKRAEERLKEAIPLPPYTGKKHILTELLEYMTVRYLCNELNWFRGNKLKPNKKVEKLPDNLEKNTFISFFRKLEPQNVIERSLKQLQFNLPEDIEIKYWSPVPIESMIPDPNTFRLGFVGKYIEVYLTARLIAMGRIGSMTAGPAPCIRRSIYQRILARQNYKKTS